jgi:hypothetical protein
MPFLGKNIKFAFQLKRIMQAMRVPLRETRALCGSKIRSATSSAAGKGVVWLLVRAAVAVMA